MFQSAIRCSDHMQNAPSLEVTTNGRRRSRERPGNVQQLAGEGDYNLDTLAFPHRSLRRLPHPGDKSHNKRY
jgi:hypothetical protein